MHRPPFSVGVLLLFTVFVLAVAWLLLNLKPL